MLASTTLADRFADWVDRGEPVKVVVVLVIAVILTAVVRAFARRLVARAMGHAHAQRQATAERGGRALPEGGAARTGQRVHAIGTLLTTVTIFLIWLNAALIALEIAGINITPVLASAGVVGVALAFGAQTLVKDYLAGIFIIVEDQYGIGDVVQFDAVTGTIEEVGLRTTHVRDDEGVIWYLRNGEILNVANRSQGRR